MCKEEVYQQFPVLAVELREQRANTYVLLSVLHNGPEKAPDRLHTCTFKQEKKEEEAKE